LIKKQSWFGVEDRANQEISQAAGNGYALNLSNLEPSTDVSLNTLRLIVEGLWDKIQDGLTLADIENVLFFIVFVRFVILALRYNLKLLSILHVSDFCRVLMVQTFN
jgi:hypothetical protein